MIKLLGERERETKPMDLLVGHFSHQHLLTRFDPRTSPGKRNQQPVLPICYGCDLPIKDDDGSPFYGCKDCDAFLHKSCLELPLECQSPCHPPHPLTLQFSGRQHFCVICLSRIPGFAYGCSICNFYVDVRCHSFASSSEIAARKLEDGGHLFFLKETKPRTQYYCLACDRCDFDTHIFTCVIPSCPRSFHFQCAPFSLPETAKPDWHIHRLTFTDKYEEEHSDEYYCDKCEEERYPNRPAYVCKDCGFVAHTSCAIFEVLPSIIAEYEKGSKGRGLSRHDAVLGNLNTNIQKIHLEENELKHEFNRLTEQIEKLEAVRAQYVASKRPAVDQLTIMKELEAGSGS